jgi:flagellar basal-body rod protein FlgF
MSGAIYMAASGALLQQMRMELLSNNLANVNTVGYKADVPVFRVNQTTTDGSELGAGANPAPYTGVSPLSPPLEASIDFSSGSLKQTGNPLDVALVGEGFFAVQTDQGIQYTRQGNFMINEDGVLSTQDGQPVLNDNGGPIEIPDGVVTVDETGGIWVDGSSLDTLQIVSFPDPSSLKKTGNTLFIPAGSDVTPQQATDFSLRQGFIELSNVNAIRAMTEMIETMRVYESYQRMIRTIDDANAKSVNEVGKVA